MRESRAERERAHREERDKGRAQREKERERERVSSLDCIKISSRLSRSTSIRLAFYNYDRDVLCVCVWNAS